MSVAICPKRGRRSFDATKLHRFLPDYASRRDMALLAG